MTLSLYDSQLEAIEKLDSGSILCGGVGSGKSRTALAYVYFKELKGSLSVNHKGRYVKPKIQKTVYIITTAHKRDLGEWLLEAAYFPNMDIMVDSWNNIEKYVKIKGMFFIFDEQRVVGKGKWAKSFIKIAKANRWILLSATPGDTWMDYATVFIANGYYRNYTQFNSEHVVFSRFSRYPKIERYVNVRKLERNRDSILVVMPFSRPTISHHIDVIVDYDSETSQKVLKERWNIFKKEPIQDAGTMCLILRRIANVDQSRILKVTSLLKLSGRAIVFYNFDYELDILREVCQQIEMPYAEWNGHKHQPVPKTNEWAYLVQYTAGCEGWNCIETDTIIFYSQNYSYKVMTQAAGRIDRLNTPYVDLYYYHLKSRSPIDKAISIALRNKKDFNERSFYGTIGS